MNGIEEIIVERINQLDKHGYSVEGDAKHNDEELLNVASSLINRNNARWPSTWDMEIFHRWMRKESRIAQLAKAGAFIAAEIDRLKAANKSEIDDSYHETHT